MRTRDLVAWSAAASAVAVSVLAVGGAPRGAQAAVAVLAAAAIGASLMSRLVFERPPALVILLAVAATLTAIQLVPLPAGVIDALDPTGAALRGDGLALVGATTWPVLSRDPANTLRALIFFLTLLGIAIAVLRIAATERGRYSVLAGVALLGAFTTLIIGVHALFGITSLYGLYAPQHADPPLLGPLLNGNHLGCLTALCATVALGLLWYPRQGARLRAMWIAVFAGCAAATLAGGSRGASLALVAGVAVVGITMLARRFLVSPEQTLRSKRPSFLTSSLPISIVAACAVALVLYSSSGGVTAQLSATSLSEVSQPRSKYAAWKSSLRLVEESPWVGVGRGGFEASFTRVHPASAFSTFSHAENEYVQAIVDWGIPGAVLLSLASAWFLISSFRRWRDGALVAAAFGGLAAVLLQSNVDFGIELLGVAAPITAVAATVAYVPLRETSRRTRVRVLRSSLVIGLLLGAILLMMPMTRSLDEDHRALGPAATVGEIRAVVQRHPIDYFPYATYAATLSRGHDPNAIAVLNHALFLHPTHPGLHRLAAQILAATGHLDQAAIEYAAVLQGTLDRHKVVETIIAELPPSAVPLALSADDERLDEMYQILVDLHRLDLAGAWLMRVLERRPDKLIACERLYSVAALQADMALVSFAREHCHGFDPTHRTRIDLAKAMLAKQGAKEVLGFLADVEDWTGKLDEKIEAWLVLCDAFAALAQHDGAKRCLRRLDASGIVPVDRAKDISSRLEKLSDAN
jgi:O-antigen ligase